MYGVILTDKDREYPLEFNNDLKEKIRERDGRKCQLCGRKKKNGGRRLHVHHIDYDKTNCSSDNLIALCGKCHRQTSSKRDFWTRYFSIYLAYQLQRPGELVQCAV